MIKKLRTTRLTLEPLRPEDEYLGVQILRSEEVNKTYMIPDLSEEAAQKLYRRMTELSVDNKRFVRGIYCKKQLVGWINDTEQHNDTIELGWVIHPAYQNRGYATEAVAEAIDALFETGYNCVLAGAFEENRASIRVMEKVGMLRQADTEELEYRGKMHHCVYYAAMKEDLGEQWH